MTLTVESIMTEARNLVRADVKAYGMGEVRQIRFAVLWLQHCAIENISQNQFAKGTITADGKGRAISQASISNGVKVINALGLDHGGIVPLESADAAAQIMDLVREACRQLELKSETLIEYLKFLRDSKPADALTQWIKQTELALRKGVDPTLMRSMLADMIDGMEDQ